MLDQLKEDIDKMIKNEQAPLSELNKLSLFSTTFPIPTPHLLGITSAESGEQEQSCTKPDIDNNNNDDDDAKQVRVDGEKEEPSGKSTTTTTTLADETKTSDTKTETCQQENVPAASIRNPVVDNFEFEIAHAIQCKK